MILSPFITILPTTLTVVQHEGTKHVITSLTVESKEQVSTVTGVTSNFIDATAVIQTGVGFALVPV